MAVTLNDIAKITGVDIGSVSRTLRNHPRAMVLRPETRQCIIETAQKLGYRRNELAATFRTGLSRTIAVIGNFDNIQIADSYNTVISGILMEATRLDYGVKIYIDNNLNFCINEILSNKINHILSMSVELETRVETAALCRLHGLKLVYIYEKSQGGFPAVTSAECEGARNAMAYLVKLGHRRIAFICGPHHFNYVTERHSGYLQGLADAGIEQDQQLICCGEDVGLREKGIISMLKMPKNLRPTAFLCIADSLAMIVQRVAIKNRMKIPEDVSIIGVGDSHLVKFAVSPITSIAQPFIRIGETALRLLLEEKCDGVSSSPDGSYLLPTQLVHRESVAPPTVMGY